MSGFIGIYRFERKHFLIEIFQCYSSFEQPGGKGHYDGIKIVELFLSVLWIASFPVVINTDLFVIQFFQFGYGGVGKESVNSLEAVLIKRFSGRIRVYKQ